MIKKSIAKVWTFQSSSGSKTYETLQYADGSTSCCCPGWTRRVANDGSRSCKHCRFVDQGIADTECESMHDYSNDPTSTPITQESTKPTTPAPAPASKKKKSSNIPVARKISWK